MMASLLIVAVIAVILCTGSFACRKRMPYTSDALAVAGMACAVLIALIPWVAK